MTKKFKVLIAEADKELASRIANQLEDQIEAAIEKMPDGLKALELISSGGFDVVLVGPVLSGMSGLEFIREASRVSAGTTMVMVGIEVGEKVAAEAIKAGAVDFVSLDKHGIARIGQVILKAMRYSQRRFLVETEEEQTRRWERMYRAAFNVAPVAVTIIDRGGTILAANKKTRELIGGGSGAVVGLNLLDFFSEWDRDSYDSSIVEDKFPYEFIAKLREYSGSTIPISVVVETLEDLPELLTVALIDLRKPVSYRRLWEYLMKDTLELVILLDGDGRILKTSKGVTSITGMPEEDQTGELIFDMGHPASRKSVNDILETAKKNGFASVQNFEYKLRDGQVRYYSGSIYRLVGGNYLIIGRDVSESRERELDLEVYGEMVAHELRTPLTAINGYVDLIKRQADLSDEDTDNLSRIRVCTERLEKMAQALFEISKVDHRDEPLREVDAQMVCEETIDMLSGVIAQTGGKVVIPDRLPLVNYLEEDLKLVLSNLISNALRYGGGEEGPLVEVSWRKYPGRCVIYVKDFGKGIPPAIKGKVAAPFFKTDDSDGMGLGLPLIRRIVESHGGDFWFESWEGEGSTFYFSIPE